MEQIDYKTAWMELRKEFEEGCTKFTEMLNNYYKLNLQDHTKELEMKTQFYKLYLNHMNNLEEKYSILDKSS